MYVYIKTEPQLWTVGFYDPQGNWHSESDHESANSAAARVAYLNGNNNTHHHHPCRYPRQGGGKIFNTMNAVIIHSVQRESLTGVGTFTFNHEDAIQCFQKKWNIENDEITVLDGKTLG